MKQEEDVLACPVVSASVLLKKPTESIHFLSRFNIEDSENHF